MSKKKNSPTEIVSIRDCAKILTARGDKISPQGLTKYINEHGLPKHPLPLASGKPGKRLGVNPEEIAAARQDYTREKMRGEHSKSTGSPAVTPKTEAEIIDAATLSQTRQAKARKEQAEADSRELALFQQTRDLLSTAEVEVLLALNLTIIREDLLGANLSDDCDAICAAAHLSDKQRKTVMAALKTRRKSIMSRLGHAFTEEMQRLDPHHADGFSARLEDLAMKIHAIRQELFAAQTNRAVS